MSNKEAMDGLLSKIYSVISAPDSLNDKPIERRSTKSADRPFISYCAPGIALDNIDFGDLTTADQVNRCSEFSQLVNSIPMATGLWASTDRKTWDIYDLVLNSIDLPIVELDQKQQDMLKRAEDFLRQVVTVTDPFTQEVKQEVRATPAYQGFRTRTS